MHISWNVIFIWETGHWTRAIKRFALFDLLKSLYSDTNILLFGDVNVKNIFTSHIDKSIIDIFNFFIFIHFHYMKMNMCSNIPASPAYGVYISQLIRYARASSNYSYFLKRHLHLRNRLLDQGYRTIFGDVNVKNIFTSHIDKKNILDIFPDFFILIHFHYMKMHRL
jgi:hypothetical protein